VREPRNETLMFRVNKSELATIDKAARKSDASGSRSEYLRRAVLAAAGQQPEEEPHGGNGKRK
jgi:hypothetical protein